MANLSEDIQCASSDTRPPMLDKIDFASWQQCIRLYCQGKENGVNILKSIDEGPFQIATTQDEKDRYNADIQATNIIHQGLPKDIYSLINHYTDAKDIWDNVKMLLEGSELTKEDRESQLYDEFEHFCQNKGETIHDYYDEKIGTNGSYQGLSIVYPSIKATKAMEKAHKDVDFVLFLLREEAQVSLTWIASLAIRVKSLSDLTAKNKDLMIRDDQRWMIDGS
ncbi:hypothetical protein Tco_0386347 [Tanacetum coccineum]